MQEPEFDLTVYILIKADEIYSSSLQIRVIEVHVHRVKTPEKRDQLQGKWDLFRVIEGVGVTMTL